MSKLVSTLHDTTHRIPGVPEHHDRLRDHRGASHHGRSLQSRSLENRGIAQHHAASTRHQTPPRVMVAWQNWIAGLFVQKTE